MGIMVSGDRLFERTLNQQTDFVSEGGEDGQGLGNHPEDRKQTAYFSSPAQTGWLNTDVLCQVHNLTNGLLEKWLWPCMLEGLTQKSNQNLCWGDSGIGIFQTFRELQVQRSCQPSCFIPFNTLLLKELLDKQHQQYPGAC